MKDLWGMKRTCISRKVLFVRRTKYCRKLYELNARDVRSVDEYRFKRACFVGGVAIVLVVEIEVKEWLHKG